MSVNPKLFRHFIPVKLEAQVLEKSKEYRENKVDILPQTNILIEQEKKTLDTNINTLETNIQTKIETNELVNSEQNNTQLETKVLSVEDKVLKSTPKNKNKQKRKEKK